MAKAYVKLWVQPGSERAVHAELLQHKSVTSVEITAGEQDMLSVIEAPTYENLLDFVTKTIRKMKGVRCTSTNLVVEL